MNKLLKYREKLNLTQEELAIKAGISARTIQRIEKGIEPKGHTLKVLAKALGVSEDDLKEAKLELVPETVPMNYQLIKYINLSSILCVIFPPINILLPLFIMKYTKQVNEITKQIVSVQILYTIISLCCIFLSPFIYKWFGLSRQLVLISMITAILVNLFIIIRNTIELDKNKKLCIRLNFSFI
ncbi:helix-turn-helix transcriptional regulator [Tenacibaculum sp.]|nr:helix-turn-helix transcriptional regulator [Tenacibaculum sp.]